MKEPMLMRVQAPDFHAVPQDQRAIDARLTNWADYVRVKFPSWVGPIWKLGKSNGRQWHQPEFRPSCDTLDGHKVEIAVSNLPPVHREVLRWAYVHRGGEIQFRKKVGLTREGLAQVLNDARRMLINRRV